MKLPVMFVAMLCSLSLFPQSKTGQGTLNLELRLVPGRLVNGIPESFTFIFVNISGHEVRMPEPSKCTGDDGTIILSLDSTPPPRSGVGGGCGAGVADAPPIIDQAKNDWKAIKPHDSLSINYARQALFVDEQAPGTYDFWAEYTPPKISAADQRALTEAGIDFPRNRLVSSHLFFTRKP